MAIGDIKAGRAYVEIGTDDTAFKQGLRQAENRLNLFEGGLKTVALGMAAIGAAAVAAGFKISQYLVEGLSAAVERGSQFVDIADRLGADVEGIQKIAFAAGRMGIEFEQLSTAIKKLQKNLGEGKIDEDLRKIGIEANAFAGMKADEAFFRVVDALRSVSDQNEQAALTMKLLGRSGQDLQAIIKEGSAELDRMGAEGVALGVIMREDVARGFESAGDAWDDAKKSLEGFFNNTRMADWIRVHADIFTEAITNHKALTQTFDFVEIKLNKQRAAAKQAKIDAENQQRFADSQAKAAEDKLRADAGTAALMQDQLQSMEAMLPAIKSLVDWEEKRNRLMEEGRKVFEATRTPEENAETQKNRARELFLGGAIDLDTFRRRFTQILAGLPQKMNAVSTSAAGTFNPFAARGLGDNDRLTKAAEETAKNTKKLADKAAQGMVLV